MTKYWVLNNVVFKRKLKRRRLDEANNALLQSIWLKYLYTKSRASRVVSKDKVGSSLVLELLQEPASNFEAAQSMISISYRKGRKYWFWTKRAKN